MARLLFVLSGNISHTPRALKSILVSTKQHKVKVIAINRGGIWENLDKELIKTLNIEYNIISLDRNKDYYSWTKSKLIELVCRLLYRLKFNTILINAYASNRTSILLSQILKKSGGNFDLIIGHSSGSLYPAWKLGRKNKIPFVFDVEDYHPGERCYRDAKNEKQRRQFLFIHLLPDAFYVIFASPLIKDRVLGLMEPNYISKSVIINNCFPSNEFEFIPEVSPKKIHFIWFSQSISYYRGLELVIPYLKKFKDLVQLHLIGNLYEDFDKQWIQPYADFISTHSIMDQKTLHKFICGCDIGLAIELTAADENRGICLTNKIWAYLQAGLFILATNTPAQVKFMEEHCEHGLVFALENISMIRNTTCPILSHLEETLELVVSNIEAIRSKKEERFNRAKSFGWENESNKLLKLIPQ